MILESIVTTVDEKANVNLAPMGPIVRNPSAMSQADHSDPQFLLRPFAGSRTYENLLATRRATIHVSDDAALFADAVIGNTLAVQSLTEFRRIQNGQLQKLIERPSTNLPHDIWAVLRRCHRWFAVEVESVQGEPPRLEMPCRVVETQVQLPFFGFNRAKHAVIEAAILATRTHLIDREEIQRQLNALRPLVEKTAGDQEHRAFDALEKEIAKRMSDRHPSADTSESK